MIRKAVRNSIAMSEIICKVGIMCFWKEKS